jgi:hypothetical protein
MGRRPNADRAGKNDGTLSIRLATVERAYLREFLRRRRLANPALTESDLVREVLHNALVAHGVVPDPWTSLDEPPVDSSPRVEWPKRTPEEVNQILREVGIECEQPLGAAADEP